MRDLPTTAAAYALALDQGFVRLDAAVAWAQQQIAELDEPPVSIIEAGCARTSLDAATQLRQVPGEVDEAAAVRQCFWHARAALDADPEQLRPIARWLHELACSGSAPSEKAEVQMLWPEDELELMDRGILPSAPQKVLQYVGELLATYGFAPQLPSEG